MINQVIIEGNLGRDTEVKESDKGKFAIMAVATSKYNGKDADGKAKYKAIWVDCVVNGNNVAYAEKLTKGTHVIIQGKLDSREWEKDGVKNSRLQIQVDDISATSRPQNSEVVQTTTQEQKVAQNESNVPPVPPMPQSPQEAEETLPF